MVRDAIPKSSDSTPVPQLTSPGCRSQKLRNQHFPFFSRAKHFSGNQNSIKCENRSCTKKFDSLKSHVLDSYHAEVWYSSFWSEGPHLITIQNMQVLLLINLTICHCWVMLDGKVRTTAIWISAMFHQPWASNINA